jgi:drug/metabolite transporter (DMT)-like permease
MKKLAPAKGSFTWSLTDTLLITTACIWGLNVVVVKAALQGIAPLSFVAIRFVIAAACSWALLFWREPDRHFVRADWPKFVWLGLTAHTLQQILFITGINLTSAGSTSLIQATSPIWVAVMVSLAGQERIGRQTILGIALSFLGIVLVTAGGGQEINFSLATTRGNLIILMSSVVFAYGTYMSKSLLTQYSPLQVSTYSISAGAIALVLFAAPTLVQHNWSTTGWITWSGVLYSAILASVVGMYLWGRGVQKLGSTRTVIYGNLSPVIAMMGGWLLLKEHLTLLQITGAFLIVFGIYTSRQSKPHPVPPSSPSMQTPQS